MTDRTKPSGGPAACWSRWTKRPVDQPADLSQQLVQPPDWSKLDDRRARLAKWSARAVQLAADYRPGEDRSKTNKSGRILRYVPPVAALGTAFVMQTIAVTDTVGGAAAAAIRQSEVAQLAPHPEIGYLGALVLGVAVASCAEGGAAYLMDLYDKHLVARDSVWVLRLGMLLYVAASAGAIHWWTAHRHLPAVMSWLLAGMSASALFLWSRGSRWRNRVAMREAGQLDPALPKLPMAAKVMHPIRAVVTLWLVSWEPVATTDEARARYDAWHAARVAAKEAKRSIVGQSDEPPMDQVDQVAVPTTPVADQPTADRVARPARTKPAVVRQLRPVQRGTVVDQLADAIVREYRSNPLPSRRKLVAHMVQQAPGLKWSSAGQVQEAIREVARRREATERGA